MSGTRPSRLTLIHLQDVNRVSNLQGQLHILRGIVVIDRWKEEIKEGNDGISWQLKYESPNTLKKKKIRVTKEHIQWLVNHSSNK